MALSLSQTVALIPILKPGMKVASMGYPDILARPEMVEKVLGDKVSGLKYREDSQKICERHHLPFRQIPDAESFFANLSCELTVYDILKERGCEILCDLNYPMVPREAYDIVLDVGTVEHCFNVSQALMNMAGLVKEGGYIIHENPFNQGNHGFYNLNPTFFVDFYMENGFEIVECRLVTKDGRGASVHPIQRFKFTQQEVNVFTLAKRTVVKSFSYPIQSKYKDKPVAGVDRAQGVVNG